MNVRSRILGNSPWVGGVDLSDEHYHTIGGFVFGLFGHLPKAGEQLRFHELRFLILEMDGKKIERLKITKL